MKTSRGSGKTSKLRRNQIDRYFHDNLFLTLAQTPKSGWVKEIRQALGMTMQDLAGRIGVIKQRVDKIEKDEVAGRLTLNTLQEAAEALNCDLVYFLVPKGEGLQKTLEKQAQAAARHIVLSTENTMQLEEQGTSKQAQNRLIESMAQELLFTEDRRIWKSPHENKKSTRRNSAGR